MYHKTTLYLCLKGTKGVVLYHFENDQGFYPDLYNSHADLMARFPELFKSEVAICRKVYKLSRKGKKVAKYLQKQEKGSRDCDTLEPRNNPIFRNPLHVTYTIGGIPRY